MTEHVNVTDEDAIRVIKLSRPEKKNAITQDMYRDMSAASVTSTFFCSFNVASLHRGCTGSRWRNGWG